MVSMVGRMVSHYEILEHLGGGGMGIVYKAEDTKLRRTVALKFLPPEFSRDPDAKARFVHEAQAASALLHDNICTIHDIDETADRQMFMCMDYYDGETLKQKIGRGPLPVHEALSLALQIARGLTKAHAAGMIHRDIKPANIMVTHDSGVKILDFGLAKLAEQTTLTRVGSQPGTVAYMSPEQIQGPELDFRTDLFSLGVIMYEMISGRRPFAADHESAIIYLVLCTDPAPLSSIVNSVSPAVERLVHRLLARIPADRFAKTEQLVEELETLCGEKESPFRKRHPGWMRRMAWMSGAVLVIAAAAWLLKWPPFGPSGGLQLPADKRIVLLPLENLGGDSLVCAGLQQILTGKLSALSAYEPALVIIPADEVRKGGVQNINQAHRALGANLAVTGGIIAEAGVFHVVLNLVDAVGVKQITSSQFDVPTTDLNVLSERALSSVARMLGYETPSLESLPRTEAGTTSQAYGAYLRARGALSRYDRGASVDRAMALFLDAINADSAFALAHAGLAEAYWRKYDLTRDVQYPESAMRACREALRLEPRLPEAHIVLGMIYRGTGRFEPAVEELREVLRQDPRNPVAESELAQAYLSLGMNDSAEQVCRRAIAACPSFWGGYNLLGYVYYRTQRYEEAIPQFLKVVELTPDNVRAQRNLGAMYHYMGSWEKAELAYERALAIKPDAATWNNLGALYFYRSHRFSDAAAAFERAIELGQQDYRVYASLGAAYSALDGKQAQAEQNYRKAIALAERQLTVNPRDGVTIGHLADFYASVQDVARARELQERALALEPSNGEVVARSVETYERLGDRNRALQCVDDALKLDWPADEFRTRPSLARLCQSREFLSLVKQHEAVQKQK
jgi:serine/threonine-protein kinase